MLPYANVSALLVVVVTECSCTFGRGSRRRGEWSVQMRSSPPESAGRGAAALGLPAAWRLAPSPPRYASPTALPLTSWLEMGGARWQALARHHHRAGRAGHRGAPRRRPLGPLSRRRPPSVCAYTSVAAPCNAVVQPPLPRTAALCGPARVPVCPLPRRTVCC